MATQPGPLQHSNPFTEIRALIVKAPQPQTTPPDLVRMGVIGYGYWGPNVARNIHSLETCQMVSICDNNPESLRRASRSFSGVELTTNISDVLTSPQIDAIAV